MFDVAMILYVIECTLVSMVLILISQEVMEQVLSPSTLGLLILLQDCFSSLSTYLTRSLI